MMTRPTMVVVQNQCMGSPTSCQAFSTTFPPSDSNVAAASASTAKGCISLTSSRSTACSRPWSMCHQEASALFTPNKASPEGSLPPYVVHGSPARLWKDSGGPPARDTGGHFPHGNYISAGSCISPYLPAEDTNGACRTHIVQQKSLHGKSLPITSHTSYIKGDSSVVDRRVVPDEAPAPPIQRAEPPVLFSTFFDRLQLGQIVAAKDKILQNVKGHNTEGLPSFEPSPNSSRSANGLSRVDTTMQLLGSVDLRGLYHRYQKSTEGRISISDRDTSASQGTAEPSPSGSDSEAEPHVPQDKVFRTEAAARLAESRSSAKAHSLAVPSVGFRVMGLWPKHAERQHATCRQVAAKSVAQPRQSRPTTRRMCRMTYRRRGDAVSPSPELPRQMLSEIAPEGSYTHMIPVSGNGNMKGLVTCSPYSWSSKGRSQDSVSARVIEGISYRYFVFNLPENEVISNTDFTLTSCISQGSFGTVYKAVWKGEVVAVKRAHGKMTLEAMRSVAREINSYRMVRHPFIVRYHGVCLDDNFVGLVTEYLDGGNIFDILYENKVTITAATRLKMCKQLLEAVHFLHTEKRLVHRDLKTANLVVDQEYNIRLCDFGKTRPLEQYGKLKLEDNGGSPRYMAPECFVEGNYVDHKVDIWGLACCLIEMLGGPIPFEDIHSNEGINVNHLFQSYDLVYSKPLSGVNKHPSFVVARAEQLTPAPALP
ncbi:tyrosine kinase-like [Cyclospora cayetanensis]|uniref:Tyrosine kinase-like n=1 Tax=Cyclospora cayetanensis TaxID=88456 RepID=A0A1D3CXC8_9EIME|nr:tyrosine kinase-like [Cyclospora cayetanensis]